MPGDRLIGSYLLRVSVRDGSRSIVLHSVRTGESQRFDAFAALAEHLEQTTAVRQERDPEREEPGTAPP